jgi:hypothetical protein
VAFLGSWLNQWKPAFYTIHHQHFGFWVITQLPPAVEPAVRSQLIEMQLSNAETQDFYVRRGIQYSPAQAEPVAPADIFADCPGDIPLSRAWKEQVLKKVYPALLFDSYHTGDLAKAQHYWKETVHLNPSWLKNRGIWSIGLKAFWGNKAKSSPRDTSCDQ